MAGTISESTGIKLTAGKLISAVVVLLGAGFGCSRWIATELTATEKALVERLRDERKASDEKYASQTDLLKSELGQTRALQAILAEVRKP